MRGRTYVSINLSALNENVRRLKEGLGSALLLAVVKADAYGHGAARVAKEIERDVDWFGVATTDEGEELRAAGITKPVLILSESPREKFESVIKNRLTMTVATLERAAALSCFARQNNQIADVHIEIDTGLSRTGFLPREQKDVYGVFSLKGLRVTGIYSHFAAADQEDTAFCRCQQDAFRGVLNALQAAAIPLPLIHFSNSAASLSFPSAQYNMARLGILLYGLNPLNDYGNDKLALKPCASWRAVVSQVKAVEKDTFVSYGLTYRTDKETVIATVPVGYADGYPRALSSRGGVLIHGSFAPVIGRVCMDHLMADVTRISNVRAGDEVVLIGKQGEQEITAADLAALCGTIPYEILCRIGTRVPRLYEP